MTLSNYAQPTPGYDYRLQIVFTLKDGSPRAWVLSHSYGPISMSFEIGKNLVEKGEADEVPLGMVINTQYYGRQVPLAELLRDGGEHGCGCQHKEAAVAAVDVVVAGKQTTEVAFLGRGRLISGSTAGEPLMAVAEADGERVACCGSCPETEGTPGAIVVDRYAGTAEGYAVAESHECPMPEGLSSQYRKQNACLPWVRVTRDPERFRQCLASARALGPIDTPKQVAKLVGPYLLKQDQEVFLVIMIDGQCQVRGISEIARGARDRVDVPVPDVLRVSIITGATAAIVVHNHPSGVRRPSESDKQLTVTLREALEQVHIKLMDHVILAGDKYYSFAESQGRKQYV